MPRTHTPRPDGVTPRVAVWLVLGVLAWDGCATPDAYVASDPTFAGLTPGDGGGVSMGDGGVADTPTDTRVDAWVDRGVTDSGPCGTSETPCCAGTACGVGLACQLGLCRAGTTLCGAVAQACCAGGACVAGLGCTQGLCVEGTQGPRGDGG